MGLNLCCVDRVNICGEGAPIKRRQTGVEIPIVNIIIFQALARGFLVRNRIKNTHGFHHSPGVLHRNVSKLSADELDKLHQKVITQRSNLPDFQYS